MTNNSVLKFTHRSLFILTILHWILRLKHKQNYRENALIKSFQLERIVCHRGMERYKPYIKNRWIDRNVIYLQDIIINILFL